MHPIFTNATGLRRIRTDSALPNLHLNPLRVESHFRGFTGSQLLRPVELLASLADQTESFDQAHGDFYFKASGRLVGCTAA